MRHVLLAFALIAAPASAQTAPEAQGAEGPELRFLSCPIYRDVDAGRKSGCWLADDPATGRRYDVTGSPVKPDWNHEVLVEGRVSTQPDACGGVILEPVRVSPMPGACTRHQLPAEGFKGRTFTLPPRNVRPIAEARRPPEGLDRETTFSMLFSWEDDFFIYQLTDWQFDQAVTFIRFANPKRITVTGWAATTPSVVSNRRIAEGEAIARRRAEKVTEALIRMGADPKIIKTEWRTAARPVAAQTADGLVEPSRRRVDIRVTP